MIDHLLQATLELVDSHTSAGLLNYRWRKHIARRMIRRNKIGDDDWLDQQVHRFIGDLKWDRKMAKKKRYEPFTDLDACTFEYIRTYFGQDYLDLMKDRLLDPENIGPRWAVHFCATVKSIGMEKVRASPDVFSFVTSHACWKTLRYTRRKFSKTIATGKNYG